MFSVWFTSHCMYSISLNFYFFFLVLSWSLRRIVFYISCIALVGNIFCLYLVGNAWLHLIVFVDFLLKPLLHFPKSPLYISPLHYVAQFKDVFSCFCNCFSFRRSPSITVVAVIISNEDINSHQSWTAGCVYQLT